MKKYQPSNGTEGILDGSKPIIMKTHLTDGLGYTQCGINGEGLDVTFRERKITCERCKKSKAYKYLILRI